MTKVGEGKFVASVENKPLKQFSTKAQIEGTAPSDKPVETASSSQPAKTAAKDAKPASKDAKPATNPFLSPLDEMNKQTGEPDTTKKPAKKTVKIAKNNGH